MVTALGVALRKRLAQVLVFSYLTGPLSGLSQINDFSADQAIRTARLETGLAGIHSVSGGSGYIAVTGHTGIPDSPYRLKFLYADNGYKDSGKVIELGRLPDSLRVLPEYLVTVNHNSQELELNFYSPFKGTSNISLGAVRQSGIEAFSFNSGFVFLKKNGKYTFYKISGDVDDGLIFETVRLIIPTSNYENGPFWLSENHMYSQYEITDLWYRVGVIRRFFITPGTNGYHAVRDRRSGGYLAPAFYTIHDGRYSTYDNVIETITSGDSGFHVRSNPKYARYFQFHIYDWDMNPVINYNKTHENPDIQYVIEGDKYISFFDRGRSNKRKDIISGRKTEGTWNQTGNIFIEADSINLLPGFRVAAYDSESGSLDIYKIQEFNRDQLRIRELEESIEIGLGGSTVAWEPTLNRDGYIQTSTISRSSTYEFRFYDILEDPLMKSEPYTYLAHYDYYHEYLKWNLYAWIPGTADKRELSRIAYNLDRQRGIQLLSAGKIATEGCIERECLTNIFNGRPYSKPAITGKSRTRIHAYNSRNVFISIRNNDLYNIVRTDRPIENFSLLEVSPSSPFYYLECNEDYLVASTLEDDHYIFSLGDETQAATLSAIIEGIPGTPHLTGDILLIRGHVLDRSLHAYDLKSPENPQAFPILDRLGLESEDLHEFFGVQTSDKVFAIAMKDNIYFHRNDGTGEFPRAAAAPSELWELYSAPVISDDYIFWRQGQNIKMYQLANQEPFVRIYKEDSVEYLHWGNGKLYQKEKLTDSWIPSSLKHEFIEIAPEMDSQFFMVK